MGSVVLNRCSSAQVPVCLLADVVNGSGSGSWPPAAVRGRKVALSLVTCFPSSSASSRATLHSIKFRDRVLSAYWVPGTVLGTGKTKAKGRPCLQGAYSLLTTQLGDDATHLCLPVPRDLWPDPANLQQGSPPKARQLSTDNPAWGIGPSSFCLLVECHHSGTRRTCICVRVGQLYDSWVIMQCRTVLSLLFPTRERQYVLY